MDYYLNVSLIGLSTKNDRCQDVTICFEKKNSNIKIMHEKLNNARIMCNHLKYKHSTKKM